MKIGFLQLDVAFQKKDRNIRRTRELLAAVDFDIMVLPELFATGAVFFSKDHAMSKSEPIPGGQTARAVMEMAREKQAWMVAGILEREGEVLYNSAMLAGPQGYVGTHRKVHLSFEEKTRCTPGTRFDVFRVAGLKLGVLICLDNENTNGGRTLAEQGAELICQPASHIGLDMPDHFRAVAANNSVFTVSCNRVGTDLDWGNDTPYIGASQIAGPDGSIIHQAPQRIETTHVMEVDI